MNGPQSLVLRVIELAGAGNYDSNGSDYPASNRYGDRPTFSDNGISFRSALYVKL